MIRVIEQQATEPTIEVTLPGTQSQNVSGATILDDAEKAASTTVLLRRVETVDATPTLVMAIPARDNVEKASDYLCDVKTGDTVWIRSSRRVRELVSDRGR